MAEVALDWLELVPDTEAEVLPASLLEEVAEELMLELSEDWELTVEEEEPLVALALEALDDEEVGISFAPMM